MENFLVRKGPRWVAIAANLIVLVVYSIFVWSWYGGAGDLFILIGPLGFLALAYALVMGFISLVLSILAIVRSKKTGPVSSGHWINLGLAVLPILLVLAGFIWVISWMKTP
jgi:hypothetical protein